MYANSDISFHLYISRTPCGDASIYADSKDGREERVGVGEKRMRRESLNQNHNQTGAKEVGGSWDSDKQSVGKTRLKSGRSDLPEDMRNESMSCSDKIAKWAFMGIQISPPLHDDGQTVLEALTRALTRRPKSHKQTQTPHPEIKLSSLSFESDISNIQCNIQTQPQKMWPDGNEKMSKRQIKKRKKKGGGVSGCPVALNWYKGGGVETIMGMYGRKEGASAKSTSLKTCSRLSRVMMWDLTRQLCAKFGIKSEEELIRCGYHQWKHSSSWYKALKVSMLDTSSPLHKWVRKDRQPITVYTSS
ncbi:hypothetical protein AAMO2058_000865600 [Amorphochlora amoebiformis]